MVKRITWTHTQSVWNYSSPLEAPYSANQWLVRNFFCCFLQQTGSSNQFVSSKPPKICDLRNYIFLRNLERYIGSVVEINFWWWLNSVLAPSILVLYDPGHWADFVVQNCLTVWLLPIIKCYWFSNLMHQFKGEVFWPSM
jgi:hypothetical protein